MPGPAPEVDSADARLLQALILASAGGRHEAMQRISASAPSNSPVTLAPDVRELDEALMLVG